ncbi:DUF488 domain-containing protein [Leptospirillum ferriphilum]|uniref:Uroporphyrin-III methyltransferase n=1 Tax=Leptospirillum ferriphilum YSK TaxID=1441628 RepID=A0A059XZJ7_9BACT|nr:DUF488 family protein [Leptospirillum ferriphilum]AIA30642.1 uroporphyrin-III methyltransferase [Leptospirillum ferriphilum YSK]
MSVPTTIEIRRIYGDKSRDPGSVRILVDRLWPRGISRKIASIDLWAKDWSPGEELRHFFHTHPDRFGEFANRYRRELLSRKRQILEEIRPYRGKHIVLLYAFANTRENNAAVLKDVLEAWLGEGETGASVH